MTHGSLFSGIGGFDLAAEWMGWENMFHCEINPFCQKVLKYHFPKSLSYADIKTTDFSIWRGTVNVLSGGFPCQPFSVAGKQKGIEDDRYLWDEMLRAIVEIQPYWVVGENVPGIINWSKGMVFDKVQTNLEAKGYKIIPVLLPACSVGAWHKRERTWFIAYADSFRCERRKQGLRQAQETRYDSPGSPKRTLRNGWFGNCVPTPRIFRGTDGIPEGVDRVKALGNAIVPQVALQIFKTIQQYEDGYAE